jgi:hypothetical protein
VQILSVDRTTLTTSEGGTERVVLRATGATQDVLVQITGLDPLEGALSSTSLLLDASNNWTMAFDIAGVDDGNVDGTQTYTLTLAAAGFQSATIQVSNEDDDLSPTSGGQVFGTYATMPSISNATVAAQRADDASQTTLREGMTAAGAGIDFRWQFVNLAPGAKVVQVDAASSLEPFRMEYSADGGATWLGFAGAPSAALVWDGDFIAPVVGSTLWVRLVDDVVSGDTVRDTLTVDLMTVSDAQVAPPTGTAALTLDRTQVSTLEGGTERVTVRAVNTTQEVSVQVGGLDRLEGSLSATTLVLNAANNWTAPLDITGIEDRNAGGNRTYSLQFTATGMNTTSVQVTSIENDVSPINGGRTAGSYTIAPVLGTNSIVAQQADDTIRTSVREGMTANGATIDFRWQFTNLAPGTKVLQVDATATVETFRLEYSTDGAATWQAFAGAPSAALAWTGDYVAPNVGTSLWVRLVDAVVAGDTTTDTIIVDLLTLAHSNPPKIDDLV